jgi:lipopolysaccharide export system permease protein
VIGKIFPILDRYIIRKFLGTFGFTILLIIVIAVIFDLTEKVDDVFEKNIPIKELARDYYLNFIPYFANLFTPLFVFISAVFFTSKMAGRTEIIAILASGMSFWRMLRPFLFSALLIGLFSFWLNSFIIPKANAGRLKFEYKYLKYNWNRNYTSLHRQITPGTFIYLDNFAKDSQTGYKFTIENLVNRKMRCKLSADYIKWDSTAQRWQLENYTIRQFKGEKEEIKRGDRLDTTFAFKPQDFDIADDDVEMMDFYELNGFIEREKLKGSSFIDYYILEKHRRFANPVANLILTLIAVAMASRKVRGGIGMHIGIGIGISFTYIMLMQVSSVFATEGGLNAAIAAWIPNAIYLVLALVLLRKAPK